MNHHRWHTASGGGGGEHGGGFMHGGVLPGGGFGGPFFGGRGGVNSYNIVQGEILKYPKFITYSTIFADTRNLGISSELVI